MTATKGIEFEGRFFWAYDVAAGVFLKHLIDEAEASQQADAPWLSQAVSRWRVQAAVTECGLTLEEDWSSATEADLHRVGRGGMQEARSAGLDTGEGNCQLADNGQVAHFPSQHNRSSHSADHRIGPRNHRIGVWKPATIT